VASGGKQVVLFLGNLLGGIAELAIFVLIVVFCFFYFSTAFPAVKESCGGFIPAPSRERTGELICKMDRAISGFVRGRLAICCVMGVIYAVGWTLCGVPHAVLLGLVVGACGLVPYLSAIGLPIAWALLVVSLTGADDKHGFYFDGEGAQAGIVWWKVLVFPLLVNVIAQVVEDYVLNPMIQGKATNLHPATILLACIAGGALAGLYGMILAIPVTACLKILTAEVLLPRFRQWVAGRKQDPLPL
jgi:predicted PurR-regulated permease PerM